ncbi:uncharacterized protein LOC109721056 [Ananas comosus]|uniref:Uncharacterized protein LOC109721056 n=1 Tax=Ananas comosus TaxID=4615 RepID=A0A6P5G6W7_ANACO|nr:uncharacterized protein LOC109721056 [Ananas comosus]
MSEQNEMSEQSTERGVVSVTREVTHKPKGGARRNSTGATISRSLDHRSNNDGKVLSRYLRASASSCHDFCKYGKRYSFEEEEKNSIPHRKGKNVLVDREHHQANVRNLEERRKNPVIKSKPSSPLNTKISNTSKGNGFVERSAKIEIETTSPAWKDITSYEVEVPLPSARPEKLFGKSSNSGDRSKKQVINLKNSIHRKSSYEGPKVEKKDFSSSIQMHEEKPIILKRSTMPSIKKSITSLKPKSVKQTSMEKPITATKPKVVKPPSLDRQKPATSAKLKSIKQGASLSHKDIDLSAKSAVSSMDQAAPNEKPSSLQTPSRNTLVLGSEEGKIRSPSSKDEREKSVVEPFTASSAEPASENPMSFDSVKCSSQDSTNPLESLERVEIATHDGDDIGEEKTLYVIEPETANINLDSFEKKSDDHEPEGAHIDLDSFEKESHNYELKTANICLDSFEKESHDYEPETINVNLDSFGKKSHDYELETTHIGLDSFEKESQDNVPETAYADLDSFEKNVPETAYADLDSFEKKSHDDNSETTHMNSDLDFFERESRNEEPEAPDVKFVSVEKKSHNDESSQPPSPNEETFEETESTISESGESDFENDGREIIENHESLKVEGNRLGQIAASLPENNDPKPHKLKFRRGKVIEISADYNNGPKRLQFRRERVVGENLSHNGQLGRSPRRRSAIRSAVSSDPSIDAPVVMLRHQDRQEKKDTQGLFNNVIEETASKLVESRKSKVKALVGAFETVISLQDGKPVSTA